MKYIYIRFYFVVPYWLKYWIFFIKVDLITLMYGHVLNKNGTFVLFNNKWRKKYK